ncbi:hypothetical protein LTR10_013836 [Elasticomyces elasticus]|uniref:Heterokaryon incompatibility domain-containing protein n=1 Tax=Exophiala sideris TaxID=1016849 RepID=A0ABR0JGI0_9EURO|nr:hypothetical protein LTR10_013836 [Elasticomyces elasticus]KAK5033186.1 hypothetical protein LTS07_003487 [Exophiala sideris]KAK5042314.1 hypothetical protein LTR13_002120 [Exophiala sideris]KAK5063730.1 hypothetical protein LTR69_003495 [Exophiala sideris]KAK5185581.1 hypothetical protein LTR44_002570 [Eurotiomycetes sp. CCFEE 6388]
MDHLPLPQNPVIKSFPIPFLCDETYDGCDFKSFPERKQWTVERRSAFMSFSHHGQSVTDHGEIGGFLQTWLYFGLLCEFTGEPIDVALFQRQTSAGTAVFTSQPLGELVSSWTVRILKEEWSLYERNLEPWKDRIYSCLLETRDVVLRVVHSLHGDSENVLSCVCLSIAVLAEYLNQALKDVFIGRGLESPVMQTWRIPDWSDCGKPILTIMQRNGWCPHKLAYFDAQDYKIIGELWYFANLEPPMAQDFHGNCTASECKLLQVDSKAYTTAHADRACQCAFRGAPPQMLADAIMHESMPLVTVSEEPTSGVVVHLQTARPDTDYVAISHVWADGMGNLDENSLPQCTLRQVRDYVNALSQRDSKFPTPFWIDTLCLPRRPFELRQKGLLSFSEAFKRAKHVLVLDSYLRGLCAQGMSPTDILARVAACGWTQRLWTFSEGRLAKSVYFQFHDQTIDLLQVVDRWRETFFRIPSLPSHTVDLAIIGTASATRIMPNQDFDRRLQEIPTLRIALSKRSTSWASDEAICLGGILGLEMSKILGADDSQKMQVVWSLLQSLPAGLAFSRASQKLTAEGYRWAPASLMGDLKVLRWGGPGPLFARLDATPSEKGLIVQFPGVLFKARNEGGAFMAKRKLFEHCLPHFGGNDGYLSLQGRDGLWYSCDIQPRWHQCLAEVDIANDLPAIILESPIVFSNSLARNGFQPMDTLRGLLVTYSVPEVGHDVIHARAHSHVDFQIVSKKGQEFNSRIKTCCEKIIERNLGSIVALKGDQGALRHQIAWWVEEYTRETGLLQLGKEIWRYRMLDDTDEDLNKHIVNFVGYLCRVAGLYEVDEFVEPITWCID